MKRMFGLVLFLVSSVAWAEENPFTAGEAGTVLPAPPVATRPLSSDATGGAIERLPASASYPEMNKGIAGGSLAGTFHGLPWPYYPKSGMAWSGSVWIDTGYMDLKRGNTNEPSEKLWLQQGRFVLRANPTYVEGPWFVQGQAELVANKDQFQGQPTNPDVDDLWVRGGQWQKWDVTLGRFEAWEVYHLGMGLDLNTQERRGAEDQRGQVPDFYGVTNLYYRPRALGNLAVHLYPMPWARFEALVQVGNESGENALGGRFAGILDWGFFRLKGAAEYKVVTPKDVSARLKVTSRGWGGTAQCILNRYVEFGINGAMALVDKVDINGNNDLPGSTTTYSGGGFANLSNGASWVLGLGHNLVDVKNLQKDDSGRVGHFQHQQSYLALQYALTPSLWLKAVGAYALAKIDPTFSGNPAYDNTMKSVRLRVTYLF